jgi:hypothetical protein
MTYDYESMTVRVSGKMRMSSDEEPIAVVGCNASSNATHDMVAITDIATNIIVASIIIAMTHVIAVANIAMKHFVARKCKYCNTIMLLQ